MEMKRSGRPAVGSTLEIPGRGMCVVVSNSDPSVIVFRAPSGANFRIGEYALRLALLSAAGGDVRPTTSGRAKR